METEGGDIRYHVNIVHGVNNDTELWEWAGVRNTLFRDIIIANYIYYSGIKLGMKKRPETCDNMS